MKLPEALKELSTKQLEQIASEVRGEIIDVTSRTGGHVASSLGSVELAVALHSTFESPIDKIIWDVGHQAYAHKILTGRLKEFSTLRQYRGISGFPNKDESLHDVFTVGHASTSISQALGLVKARDLGGEKHSVVAVIGDASISGGLAFEGVNNVDGLKSNMIVVLNDNEMSISKNVGAIANYLTQVQTSGTYLELRDRIEKLVKRVPRVGVPLFEAARKLKDRTRHMVISFKVDVIFEELGFKYFGPIDGHNIPLLMSTLHHAKDVPGPVLIHIITKKGKGFVPAEKEPTRFHGTGPYDKDSGMPVNGNGKQTYTSVFGKTMLKLGHIDPKITAVTAAMIDGTGLEEFARVFPTRFFDVGIAEEHAVTFAGGLARGGFKPVVAVYSTFLQRAYDQIVHDVCLQNLPVIFAVDRAGIVGEDGATHNGIFDIAFLRSLPNMMVMAPKDENELQHMLFTAAHHNGPIAIRYPRGSSAGQTDLDNELVKLEIGKGEIVHRSHISHAKKHVALFALGSMVETALQAAPLLEASGTAVKVINARFVKPLDKELLVKSCENIDLLVALEEGGVEGGFGSALSEALNAAAIVVPFLSIGLPNQFIEHGIREFILQKYGLSAERIAEKVMEKIKL
mgnify:CR=1 FL=1